MSRYDESYVCMSTHCKGICDVCQRSMRHVMDKRYIEINRHMIREVKETKIWLSKERKTAIKIFKWYRKYLLARDHDLDIEISMYMDSLKNSVWLHSPLYQIIVSYAVDSEKILDRMTIKNTWSDTWNHRFNRARCQYSDMERYFWGCKNLHGKGSRYCKKCMRIHGVRKKPAVIRWYY